MEFKRRLSSSPNTLKGTMCPPVPLVTRCRPPRLGAPKEAAHRPPREARRNPGHRQGSQAGKRRRDHTAKCGGSRRTKPAHKARTTRRPQTRAGGAPTRGARKLRRGPFVFRLVPVFSSTYRRRRNIHRFRRAGVKQ